MGLIMKIENADKQKVKDICRNLSSRLLTHPLFMYYCPEKAVRRDYINAYLNYFINSWSKNDIILTNETNTVLVSLVNPQNYKYKFSGKGACAMKQYKLASNVFEHQNEVAEIFDVVVPESREGRVMTIYANVGTEFNEIQELVKEAMQIAKEQGFVLVYDTFSLRMQPFMRKMGFKLVYNKNFLSTKFIHCAMVCNL